MTFVSIIIPFNKGKRYLKDCLDSLLEQDLDDEEIIIVSNGVKEDLDDLLNHYSELNIIIKSFDDEIGVAKARNEGLKIAQGEYVYFMDSDDYVYLDGLARLIDVACKTGADFINGERINTAFIRHRFDEELQKETKKPLAKHKFNDKEFSIKLIVGEKTNNDDLISILHALIRKDLLENLLFNEKKRYDSDYEFALELIPKLNNLVGVENAIYAKRLRDDPVNLTSLNQEIEEDSFLNLFNSYKYVFSKIRKDSSDYPKQLKLEITKKLFKYYSKTFIPNFLDNQNSKWRNDYFDMMSEISFEFNALNINSKQVREIKALQDKNRRKFKLILKFKLHFNKFKKVRKDEQKRDIEIYNNIYNKQKIKENQIIFESFRGDFYTDSPKYLYEYLYRNYKNDYNFVWVIDDENVEIPGNPKRVERFSLSYYKEYAKSKYWVINGRQPARLKKRDGQLIVSTWHGTPLKKLGLDMDNVYTEDPNIKKSYVKVAKQWDYLISPNRFTTKVYKSAFAYSGEILEYGYPRNDILYNADENRIDQIKTSLNIPKDKKVILYAPTWRDDEFFEVGKVKFELKLQLDELKHSLQDDYIILVRTHYFISDNIDLSDVEGFAFDVSKYDDIAELYLVSDILITDYSSVFFDYANLKRPILFYTYDLEKYENVLRGFYLDIHNDLPGPLLFTTEEVINSIIHIDDVKKEYGEEYDEFYDKFCSFEDGNASKRIVDRIWGK